MSYTYEKVSSNKAKLSFVITADEFAAAVQAAYLKSRKSIQLPGFRKGHAPRAMIESIYGPTVFFEDAVEDIANREYPAAIDAEKLEVVDRPQMDVQQMEAGKELKFTCEVFVKPDVTLGDYKDLEVEITRQTVSDKEIEDHIEADRKKVARTVEVEDRAVEDGDSVKLDYAGTVDGVAFEGGTAEDQTLVIGSNSFIPGFEAQMVGMNIGEEKDLNVTFPEEYHAEELAGKAAVFHVKVNAIEKTELPAADDDFASDMGFDSFAAYRESIAKELNERAGKNNEVSIENALVEKAVANAQVEIPQPMIEEQENYILREMQMNMAYQGIRLEDFLKYTGQTVDQLRASYAGEAERRVRTELVLEAIRKAEGIEPSEEDIARQTEENAKRMGQEVEAFKESLTDEQRSYLTDTAAIQKVVDLMKASAKVSEKAAEAPEAAAEEKPADAE